MTSSEIMCLVASLAIGSLVYLVPTLLFGSELVGLCAVITFFMGYLYSGLILWDWGN